MRMTTTRPAPMFLALVVLMTAGVSSLLRAAPMPEPEVEFRKLVEEDWDRQEQRLGRNPASVESLISAVERAEAWWRRRGARSGTPGVRHDQARLDELRRAAAEAETLDAEARLRGYRQARWLTRQVALEESGITRQPIVFLQRNRFICQMLHEYMGYFYDYGNVAGGGGVFLLEQPGSLAADSRARSRRPAAERQLHHAGAVLRRAAPSTSRSPNGRTQTRFLLARCAGRSTSSAWRRTAPTCASSPRRRGRFRSVPAARWRRGLHVDAARRIRPLQQRVGTVRQLHAASHGRGRRATSGRCRCTKPASGIPP